MGCPVSPTCTSFAPLGRMTIALESNPKIGAAECLAPWLYCCLDLTSNFMFFSYRVEHLLGLPMVRGWWFPSLVWVGSIIHWPLVSLAQLNHPARLAILFLCKHSYVITSVMDQTSNWLRWWSFLDSTISTIWLQYVHFYDNRELSPLVKLVNPKQ